MVDKSNIENIEKGTVEEYKEDSSSNYKAILSTFSLRDIALVIGFVLGLQLLGIINIPFVSQIDNIRYGDYMLAVLVSVVLTYATVWQKFSSWIDEIYSKDWSYVAYVNATDDFFGVWKTDPQTLNRMEDFVEFKGEDRTVTHYREGIDKAGRRYAIVRDVQPLGSSETAEYRMQNIMGWDTVPDDPAIISDKTELKSWMEEVLPMAEQGRKERMSQSAMREKAKTQTVHNLVRKFEKATSSGSLDMQKLRDNMLDSYEKANQDVDNFIRETEAYSKPEPKESSLQSEEQSENDD